ncbi:hypothetical protein SNE32_16205, partial [Lysobacter sp. D1-1-M9]|uniref:hypothetical protein n=1 Tax=Novilysobacter longmucuonensis TaxID=3098603 RepID=UPI002FCC8E93
TPDARTSLISVDRSRKRGILNALGCMTVMMMTGCLSASPRPSSDPAVQVIEVRAPVPLGSEGRVDGAACAAWQLDVAQVEQFFRLSEEFEESPYAMFYQLPCKVTGRLVSEGQSWNFSIDGGGTAVWTDQGRTRYWGCSAEACEPLVLLRTDMMSP